MKKDKMINSDLQKKLHRKLKTEQHESHLKLGRIRQSDCTNDSQLFPLGDAAVPSVVTCAFESPRRLYLTLV
jgi:hypothetical protein